MPALRAVRRLLPDHEVVLGCPAVYEPLVSLSGSVDRVCDVSGLTEPTSLGVAPDIAIDLHGRGPQSHRLLQSLRPSRLVGFACDEIPGPVWQPDEHEVSRWCRLVAEAFNVDVDPGDLRLARPAIKTPWPGAVVIHPGAAREARRWPATRFAAVASWAASLATPVVVTGSAQEEPLARQVAAAAGLPATSVLAGRLSLTELAALVNEASLVVCGDTGAAHLASAYSTASVVLFGPVSPSLWGPPAAGPHMALWRGTTPGDPWGDVVDPSLLRISSEEVIEAVQGLLRDKMSLAKAHGEAAGERLDVRA